MRIFVSIGWQQETIDLLQSWQEKLQKDGAKGYWRRGENLHLTLKFLGEVDPAQIARVKAALELASKKVNPFALTLGGLGVFPNLREPRILWMGVKSPDLIRLQASIDEELAKVGFPREQRTFRPHITLASGGIAGLTQSLLVQGNSIQITEQAAKFELMESSVERGVRRYSPLVSYPLGT